MNKIGIICDSTAYLSDEYINSNNVKVVKLTLTMGGKTYTDLVDIDNKLLFERINAGEKVTTSQPSPEEFLNAIIEKSEEFSKIICLTVSTGISGTYNSACIARDMYEGDAEVVVLDTRTAGMGIQGVIDTIIENAGKSFNEVVKLVESVISASKTYLTIDDLQTLVKTGRMKMHQALIGNVLRVKPLLVLDDEGKVAVFEKIRTQKRLVGRMCDLAKEFDASKVYISFIGNKDGFIEIVKFMKERLGKIELVECGEVGPVMAVHLGKGGLGVFLKKNTL